MYRVRAKGAVRRISRSVLPHRFAGRLPMAARVQAPAHAGQQPGQAAQLHTLGPFPSMAASQLSSVRLQREREEVDTLAAAAAAAASAAAAAAPPVASAAEVEAGGHLRVRWRNGSTSRYHSVWLQHNAPGQWQAGTGQKVSAPSDVARWLSNGLAGAQLHQPGGRALTLRFQDGTAATYSTAWLLQHSYADHPLPATVAEQSHITTAGAAAGAAGTAAAEEGHTGISSVEQQQQQRQPMLRLASASVANTPLETLQGANIPRFTAHGVLNHDGAAWRLLHAVATRGLALVRGMGTAPDAVLSIARRLGPPMQTIYGTTWEVSVRADPINIAYSAAQLCLHQDLAYYESKPGLQLLHCREFDDAITGGASAFVDGLAAMEALRRVNPVAFHTLQHVPATFQKIHSSPERSGGPVHMVYRRPHAVTDPRSGRLTALNWAPPFEGPLHVAEAAVLPYYAAYAAFAAILSDVEARAAGQHFHRFRLEPGHMVVFNNQRMLHGRDAFALAHEAEGSDAEWSSGSGRIGRVLQGCYVSADDWASKYRVLSSTHGQQGAADGGSGAAAGGGVPWLGNGTW